MAKEESGFRGGGRCLKRSSSKTFYHPLSQRIGAGCCSFAVSAVVVDGFDWQLVTTRVGVSPLFGGSNAFIVIRSWCERPGTLDQQTKLFMAATAHHPAVRVLLLLSNEYDSSFNGGKGARGFFLEQYVKRPRRTHSPIIKIIVLFRRFFSQYKTCFPWNFSSAETCPFVL